jgi:hypothetical protein
MLQRITTQGGERRQSRRTAAMTMTTTQRKRDGNDHGTRREAITASDTRDAQRKRGNSGVNRDDNDAEGGGTAAASTIATAAVPG